MVKKFNELNRIIQVILLFIPIVNWIVEILVRWSAFIHYHDISHLIFAILVSIFGLVFGWIDVIWCLLFKHMFYAV